MNRIRIYFPKELYFGASYIFFVCCVVFFFFCHFITSSGDTIAENSESCQKGDFDNQNDLYICYQTGDGYFINEDKFLNDFEGYEKRVNNILKINIRDGDRYEDIIYFYKTNKEIRNVTDINIGDVFFVSKENEIVKCSVSGYCYVIEVCGDPSFYILLSPYNQESVRLEFENDYRIRNSYVCSRKASIRKSTKTVISNSETMYHIFHKLRINPQRANIDFGDDYSVRIFQGHFTDKMELQYAVSLYNKEGFTSGICIMDSNFNLIKNIYKFSNKNENKYLIISYLDYDDDGLDELLISYSEMNEAGCEELMHYENNSFEVVVRVMHWEC